MRNSTNHGAMHATASDTVILQLNWIYSFVAPALTRESRRYFRTVLWRYQHLLTANISIVTLYSPEIQYLVYNWLALRSMAWGTKYSSYEINLVNKSQYNNILVAQTVYLTSFVTITSIPGFKKKKMCIVASIDVVAVTGCTVPLLEWISTTLNKRPKGCKVHQNQLKTCQKAPESSFVAIDLDTNTRRLENKPAAVM